MCTSCGCSDGAHATVIDLATGKHRAVEAPHAPVHPHEHGHEHPHVHSHAHDDHDREHSHAHPHTHGHSISLEQDVLAANDRLAMRNRGWFEGRNILALNLMSSPGAGKTTLLERTLRDLKERLSISVVEGDQETTADAQRIRATGCRTVQVNTGTGCHLDAQMLGEALKTLAPPPDSLLMIENVGNLVCPALFDLGEAAKVVILSVTEGDDKPAKYPHMFRTADLMILNKLDLLPHVSFDTDACIAHARRINPDIEVLQVSATRGDGLDAWYQWLMRRVQAMAPTEHAM